MVSITVFPKNNGQLNLKGKLLPQFRVPSAFSLIKFYCVFKTCEMDARSAYSIYVQKKAHSVQSEMLSKSYFGKKTIVSQVVKLRNYREGIRYVVKVYYKVYLSIFETYGSKLVTFANFLR